MFYIHGYHSSKDSFRGKQLVDTAEEIGVDCFTFDGLGFGEQECKLQNACVSDRIAQAQELITELLLPKFGYERIIIMGASLGGYLASIMCRDLPILEDVLKGALIMCPAVAFPFPTFINFREYANEWQLKKFDDGETIDFIPPGGFSVPISKLILSNAESYSFASPKKIKGSYPFKLIWGSNDKLVSPMLSSILLDRIENKKERAELVLLEGSDHFLAKDSDRDVIMDLVKEVAAFS